MDRCLIIALLFFYYLVLSDRQFYYQRWCHTPVESETFVRSFSPGSTLEPGLKAFRRRGPKCSLETPPLVHTNREKRAASERHFPVMIDAGF
jgi:hypothetical protein